MSNNPGRPPRLKVAQEWWIQGRYAELWAAEWKRKLDAETEKHTRNVAAEWQKARKVPTASRKEWLKWDGEDHLASVKIAIHKDNGAPDIPEDENHPDHGDIAARYDSEPNRLIPMPRRPKGCHKQIEKQVAEEASLKFGVEVSTWMVERLWYEYCQDLRKIDQRF